MPANAFQFTARRPTQALTVQHFRKPDFSSAAGGAPHVIPPSDINAPSRLYGTPANSQTITDENKLFVNRAHLKVLTSRVAMHLADSQRADLFRQIDELLSIEDWTDTDQLIRIASYNTFLRFLAYYGRVKRASLTVTSDGNLAASWFGQYYRLTIEFLANDEVRLVMWRELREDHGSETAAYQGLMRRVEPVVASFDGTEWYQNGAA